MALFVFRKRARSGLLDPFPGPGFLFFVLFAFFVVLVLIVVLVVIQLLKTKIVIVSDIKRLLCMKLVIGLRG